MPKFRKKPVVIDAIQYRGEHDAVSDLLRFFKDAGARFVINPPTLSNTGPGHIDLVVEDGEPIIRIHTLEGVMIARHNDWIIRGVKGEFYPCKPDIFEATYEPVP